MENSETTLLVLNNGTSTTYADIDLSSFVPPTSELSYLGVQKINSSVSLRIRENGQTNQDNILFGKIDRNGWAIWQTTDTSQIVEYKLTGSGTAVVQLLGYREEL